MREALLLSELVCIGEVRGIQPRQPLCRLGGKGQQLLHERSPGHVVCVAIACPGDKLC